MMSTEEPEDYTRWKKWDVRDMLWAWDLCIVQHAKANRRQTLCSLLKEKKDI